MTKKKSVQRLYDKMGQEPKGFLRLVGAHKRKGVNNKQQVIKEYVQSYSSPRGRIRGITPDMLTKKSQTIWLMDKEGHFVGRANHEGKTTAKNVIKYGYDETTVNRDAKRYKRILGRTSGKHAQ